jgi:hypothetical protein
MFSRRKVEARRPGGRPRTAEPIASGSNAAAAAASTRGDTHTYPWDHGAAAPIGPALVTVTTETKTTVMPRTGGKDRDEKNVMVVVDLRNGTTPVVLEAFANHEVANSDLPKLSKNESNTVHAWITGNGNAMTLKKAAASEGYTHSSDSIAKMFQLVDNLHAVSAEKMALTQQDDGYRVMRKAHRPYRVLKDTPGGPHVLDVGVYITLSPTWWSGVGRVAAMGMLPETDEDTEAATGIDPLIQRAVRKIQDVELDVDDAWALKEWMDAGLDVTTGTRKGRDNLKNEAAVMKIIQYMQLLSGREMIAAQEYFEYIDGEAFIPVVVEETPNRVLAAGVYIELVDRTDDVEAMNEALRQVKITKKDAWTLKAWIDNRTDPTGAIEDEAALATVAKTLGRGLEAGNLTPWAKSMRGSGPFDVLMVSINDDDDDMYLKVASHTVKLAAYTDEVEGWEFRKPDNRDGNDIELENAAGVRLVDQPVGFKVGIREAAVIEQWIKSDKVPAYPVEINAVYAVVGALELIPAWKIAEVQKKRPYVIKAGDQGETTPAVIVEVDGVKQKVTLRMGVYIGIAATKLATDHKSIKLLNEELAGYTIRIKEAVMIYNWAVNDTQPAIDRDTYTDDVGRAIELAVKVGVLPGHKVSRWEVDNRIRTAPDGTVGYTKDNRGRTVVTFGHTTLDWVEGLDITKPKEDMQLVLTEEEVATLQGWIGGEPLAETTHTAGIVKLAQMLRLVPNVKVFEAMGRYHGKFEMSYAKKSIAVAGTKATQNGDRETAARYAQAFSEGMGIMVAAEDYQKWAEMLLEFSIEGVQAFAESYMGAGPDPDGRTTRARVAKMTLTPGTVKYLLFASETAAEMETAFPAPVETVDFAAAGSRKSLPDDEAKLLLENRRTRAIEFAKETGHSMAYLLQTLADAGFGKAVAALDPRWTRSTTAKTVYDGSRKIVREYAEGWQRVERYLEDAHAATDVEKVKKILREMEGAAPLIMKYVQQAMDDRVITPELYNMIMPRISEARNADAIFGTIMAEPTGEARYVLLEKFRVNTVVFTLLKSMYIDHILTLTIGSPLYRLVSAKVSKAIADRLFRENWRDERKMPALKAYVKENDSAYLFFTNAATEMGKNHDTTLIVLALFHFVSVIPPKQKDAPHAEAYSQIDAQHGDTDRWWLIKRARHVGTNWGNAAAKESGTKQTALTGLQYDPTLTGLTYEAWLASMR